MRKLIVIVLTVLSINCFSQTKNFIDQNYIEVTGKAEIEIIPNEIEIVDGNSVKVEFISAQAGKAVVISV